ncbi:MAG: Cys-tRNA(Pro) deacylase [Roseburia sp.]|nr:Cys-tRNA(Pro) deacylase [Roseburia sp.]
MSKALKTNALRLLDKAGIPYTVHTYEVDENNLAATHTAEQVGVDVHRLFKTLVLRGERNGLFVCVVPGDAEVDLKKAASVAGDKKADLIPMKELLPNTGYIRGACSPVGMKKLLPTFFHLTATDWPTIYLSAGQRGLQMEVNPNDVIKFTGATCADLVKS